MADGPQRFLRKAFKANEKSEAAAALAELQDFGIVGDIHRGLAEPLDFKIGEACEQFAA